ncbi:MAG: LacI family transcriptional regulator [Clostridium sp.]|nr:LacI family transcriptional regulator [Clostridium sp.]
MKLKDIAELAGVSISTVSRVLNSPDGSFGTQEVRERIWKIAKEGGYTPNHAARDLRSKKSTSMRASTGIACVYGRHPSRLLSIIGRHVEYQAMEMDSPVLSTYSLEDVNDAGTFETLSSIGVNGAVIIGQPTEKMVALLKARYRHIVYTGLQACDDAWDQVICDAYEVAERALMYLVECGHRKVGYIGKTEGDRRYQAYLDITAKCGLVRSQKYVQKADTDPEQCYNAAGHMVEKCGDDLPSAIFCANDMTSIAVMKALQEMKIVVPDRISIISAQNLEIAQFTTPMLTTVNVPGKQMGIMATKMLVDRMNGGMGLPMKVLVPHELVIRESVKRLN